MKRLMLTALLVGSLASAGCVRMNMETVVGEDSGGTCTLSYTMSSEVAAAIKDLGSLDTGMQDQKIPALDEITRERADAVAAAHDVKIEKFERTESDGQQHFEMVLAFARLEDFSRMMGELMDESSGPGEIFAIFRTEDGNYRLVSVPDPEATTGAEDEEEDETAAEQDPAQMDPQQMQKSMEVMGKLMAHISELDVRMAFTVPGDIIATNAPSHEGRTAVWQVNASNMMSMENSEMEPDITFSGEGLRIEAPVWSE